MNSGMKKFLCRAALIPVAVIAAMSLMVLFGIFVIGGQYQDYYTASALDKIARLKSINEPKIILAGNSNLAFGINSAMLQEELGMPVVNMGLHGGLGNAFHENIASLSINSGDIVILSHTDFADNDELGDIPLVWSTVEYHRELWEIVRANDYPDMLKGFPKYWLRAFILWASLRGNRDSAPPYSRSAFNEYGDVIARPEAAGYSEEVMFKPGSIKVPGINSTCIDRLNALNRYVIARGAVMVVAGYPIAQGRFTPPAEDYDIFQKELAGKLDCEIISDYRDYFIPYKYFYNSPLHLGAEGASLRTMQLIKDINAWKDSHKNSPAP